MPRAPICSGRTVAIAPVPVFATERSLRDVNLAMGALTLSLFVAYSSNLVVLTALPKIVADLHGSQASYTWIVTASMLTMAVCMPTWGRLSEIVDRKKWIQAGVIFYVLASICAGFAQATWVIIACRAAIGFCASGIIILMQGIAAEIATPRHRARWIGYQGAAISFATVGAPSLGGFVAQHFGWRWCFFLGVPTALPAIVMLHYTLDLPHREHPGVVRIDWPGAFLIAATIVGLMLWVSLIGPEQGFTSPSAFACLVFAALTLATTIWWERRAPRPILPFELLGTRDMRLGAVAALGTGAAFYGCAVYLALFLQIGRGFSPEVAGLMALPEAAAALLGALVASRFIAHQGRYKAWLIGGGSMVITAFALLSTIDRATTLPFVGMCVALIGGGLGMVSENLVLMAQTSVTRDRAASAAALVNFFRMVSGITFVQAMGALLTYRVGHITATHGLILRPGSSVPALGQLAPASRAILQNAYADGAATVFLAAIPLLALMLVAIFLLSNRVLEPDAPTLSPNRS